MTVEFDNFIGIYDDVLSKEFCDKMIEHFGYAELLSLVTDRQTSEKVPELLKADKTYFLNDEKITTLQVYNSDIIITMKNMLKHCFEIYFEKYSILNKLEYGIFSYRIQKTEIGEGYHVWHYEKSSLETSSRMLTVILYLNDVEEGGETEFHYIPKRVKAKAGRLVIFPCDFTHTHKGNSPLSNEKYIITTWSHYIK
jgi:hypothetical protein